MYIYTYMFIHTYTHIERTPVGNSIRHKPSSDYIHTHTQPLGGQTA